MNTEQKIEGNKLKPIIEKFVVTETAKGNHAIMVFDGWELRKMQTFDPDNNYQNPGSNDYYVYEKNGRTCRIEDIEYDIVYHQSWDALMPVVEKIESLGFIFYTAGFSVRIEQIEPDADIYDDMEMEGIETKIQAMWLAVTSFITWYNTQKQNQ